MKLKVAFSPTADAEFLAVIAYIGFHSPSAAVDFRDKTLATLARLRDFPESGRTLPEFPDSLFREVIVSPYRFFYRVRSDKVWIVAVWHAAQLPTEPDHAADG